jgi:3-ketosteroid 9alpha-monooxygenase subunit A
MSPQVLPPFPTGWFAIAYSADLKSGEVTTTTFCGQEVVVFRDSSGRPAVLDAYCPHLGAHLGHGGTVSDEGIRCPFHGWLWSPEGRCVDMPYGGRISPGAKTRSWPVTE